jgi:hypothetical protein
MVSTSPKDDFQANRLVFDAKNKILCRMSQFWKVIHWKECEFGLMMN